MIHKLAKWYDLVCKDNSMSNLDGQYTVGKNYHTTYRTVSNANNKVVDGAIDLIYIRDDQNKPAIWLEKDINKYFEKYDEFGRKVN